MQILHPTTGALYTGLTNAVSTIYRIEGWRTLWKGVSSVIVGAGMSYVHGGRDYDRGGDYGGHGDDVHEHAHDPRIPSQCHRARILELCTRRLHGGCSPQPKFLGRYTQCRPVRRGVEC